MAKTPVSDEEVSLRKKARRRLVGAIVLVLLMVVFVPMFLDREPRETKKDIDIRIPAVPGKTNAPLAPNLPPPPSGTPNESPAPAPQSAVAEPPPAAPVKPVAETAAPAPAVAPEPAPAPPSPPEKPAAKPAPKPVAEAPEPAPKSDAKSSEPLVIQLGAFSDARNARHLLEKLKAEKIPAYIDTIKTPRGERTRVRAGPYPNMAAAERGLARLKTLKLIPGGDAKISSKGE